MTGLSPSGSALTIPRFVTLWIIFASILVTWDCGYLLNRPRSMAGGDLYWLFRPYSKYITLDLLYGNLKNSFVVTQAWLNVLEVIGGIGSLLIYHGSRSATKKNFACMLLLVTCVATLWKTVLYFWHDFIDMGIHPDQHPADNTWFDYILMFILPNFVWILLPSISVWNISKQILTVCEKVQPKAKKN